MDLPATLAKKWSEDEILLGVLLFFDGFQTIFRTDGILGCTRNYILDYCDYFFMEPEH